MDSKTFLAHSTLHLLLFSPIQPPMSTITIRNVHKEGSPMAVALLRSGLPVLKMNVNNVTILKGDGAAIYLKHLRAIECVSISCSNRPERTAKSTHPFGTNSGYTYYYHGPFHARPMQKHGTNPAVRPVIDITNHEACNYGPNQQYSDVYSGYC